MNKIVDKLILLFRLNRGDQVKNYGYFEGFLSIVVNLLLFILKFTFGTILNSIALIADSLHTLSDIFTSVLIVAGFKISAKPPDEKHPFGHGRAEQILAIIVASILIFVGIEFLINSIKRFIQPVPIHTNLLIIILLGLSILVKEFLTAVALNLSKRINSSSLKADAWHHRTDSIATALVVIGFMAFHLGIYWLDGVLGIGISLLIVYTGVIIIRESGSFLLGEAPKPMVVDKIKEIVHNRDGVADAHDIHVHDYGGKLLITVHIRMKDDTHLDDAHRVATEIEEAIRNSIVGASVTVHIEPNNEMTS
ncbi:MAG: cation diffusion facilitator family transporter [candidate division WOR-3 bacterium]